LAIRSYLPDAVLVIGCSQFVKLQNEHVTDLRHEHLREAEIEFNKAVLNGAGCFLLKYSQNLNDTDGE